MSTTPRGSGPPRRRTATGTLLRLADEAVEAAELLVQAGQRRPALVLLRHACRTVLDAVVASEQGWPLPDQSTLEAVRPDDPARGRLFRATAAVEALAGTTARPNGQVPPEPDAGRLTGAADELRRLIASLVRMIGSERGGTRGREGRTTASCPARAGRERPASAGAPPANPPERTERRPIVVRRSRPAAADPAARGKPAAARPPSPPRREATAPDATSTVFWTLMDRWRIADLEALALVGHRGGLTKRGTRPRFRVTGREALVFSLLQEIDAALGALREDPGDWLRRPRRGAPLAGTTPLDHIRRRGDAGAKEVLRAVTMLGLRRSI